MTKKQRDQILKQGCQDEWDETDPAAHPTKQQVIDAAASVFIETSMAVKSAAQTLGRRGGLAGRGASQRRGDSEHYRALAAKRKRAGRRA